MLHDPTAYPEPFSFKPERFLASDGSFQDDPLLSAVFGFGRRLCPGRHFVDSSLFLVVSCILSAFYVGPPKDEQGNELPVEIRDSGANSRCGLISRLGLVCGFLADTCSLRSRPLDFRCSITPRDSRAKDLIIAANM